MVVKITERFDYMLRIHDNIVEFTRGDTVNLTVNMRHTDGTPYVMQNGDTLTLSVRKAVGSPVIIQEVSDNSAISLTADQTKQLEPGLCCYDIELKTAGGGVYTVVGITDTLRQNMRVWPEVTE